MIQSGLLNYIEHALLLLGKIHCNTTGCHILEIHNSDHIISILQLNLISQNYL